MKSALAPAIENIESALEGLESALEKLITKEKKKPKKEPALPQLALARNEKEVTRKIAAKLDQTINRLETLLTEEA